MDAIQKGCAVCAKQTQNKNKTYFPEIQKSKHTHHTHIHGSSFTAFDIEEWWWWLWWWWWWVVNSSRHPIHYCLFFIVFLVVFAMPEWRFSQLVFPIYTTHTHTIMFNVDQNFNFFSIHNDKNINIDSEQNWNWKTHTLLLMNFFSLSIQIV